MREGWRRIVRQATTPDDNLVTTKKTDYFPRQDHSDLISE